MHLLHVQTYTFTTRDQFTHLHHTDIQKTPPTLAQFAHSNGIDFHFILASVLMDSINYTLSLARSDAARVFSTRLHVRSIWLTTHIHPHTRKLHICSSREIFAYSYTRLAGFLCARQTKKAVLRGPEWRKRHAIFGPPSCCGRRRRSTDTRYVFRRCCVVLWPLREHSIEGSTHTHTLIIWTFNTRTHTFCARFLSPLVWFVGWAKANGCAFMFSSWPSMRRGDRRDLWSIFNVDIMLVKCG